MDKFYGFIRRNLCIVFMASVVLCVAVLVGFSCFPAMDGEGKAHQNSNVWGLFLILAWTFLILGVAWRAYKKKWLPFRTAHWILLNYAIPYLLILVPLMITSVFPQDKDWFDKALFPTSGGLWVFLILFYTIVQSDIEEKLTRLQAHDPDQWLWRFFSKMSFCFIIAGAMCYMAPILLDFYGVIEFHPLYKLYLGLVSFCITTSLPVFGMLIVKRIHQSETGNSVEVLNK